MGITKVAFNIAALEVAIRQTGTKSIKRGLNVMREEGDEIVKLARENAPEDEGDLERAIERDPNEERDENRRAVVSIWVNPEAPGHGGLKVGDYGYLMHEGLAPYGDGTYNPGEGTLAKGPQAGGKFLERAVMSRRGPLGKKLAAMYRKMFA